MFESFLGRSKKSYFVVLNKAKFVKNGKNALSLIRWILFDTTQWKSKFFAEY